MEARLSLLVLRCRDLERAASFYRLLGLELALHRHGGGSEHYAFESDGLVFELYPARDEADSTAATRIGFQGASLDEALARLAGLAVVVGKPRVSPWGRRAVVADPDGHRVELTELGC